MLSHSDTAISHSDIAISHDDITLHVIAITLHYTALYGIVTGNNVIAFWYRYITS